jgi:hypothetical protein
VLSPTTFIVNGMAGLFRQDQVRFLAERVALVEFGVKHQALTKAVFAAVDGQSGFADVGVTV